MNLLSTIFSEQLEQKFFLRYNLFEFFLTLRRTSNDLNKPLTILKNTFS